MADEKRLIEANALIEEINQQRRASRTSFPRRSYVVGDVLTSIYNAPTVDAVEVVRCRDCINYIEIGLDKHRRCSIFCGCYDSQYPTEPDDFCSYGERKQDAAQG